MSRSACHKIRAREQTVGTCYAEAAFTVITTGFRDLLMQRAKRLLEIIHTRRQEYEYPNVIAYGSDNNMLQSMVFSYMGTKNRLRRIDQFMSQFKTQGEFVEAFVKAEDELVRDLDQILRFIKKIKHFREWTEYEPRQPFRYKYRAIRHACLEKDQTCTRAVTDGKIVRAKDWRGLASPFRCQIERVVDNTVAHGRCVTKDEYDANKGYILESTERPRLKHRYHRAKAQGAAEPDDGDAEPEFGHDVSFFSCNGEVLVCDSNFKSILGSSKCMELSRYVKFVKKHYQPMSPKPLKFTFNSFLSSSPPEQTADAEDVVHADGTCPRLPRRVLKSYRDVEYYESSPALLAGEDGGQGTRMVWSFFHALYCSLVWMKIKVDMDTIKKGERIKGRESDVFVMEFDQHISQESRDSFEADPIHAQGRCGILSIDAFDDKSQSLASIPEDDQAWPSEFRAELLLARKPSTRSPKSS